jgi:hypothetical protein
MILLFLYIGRTNELSNRKEYFWRDPFQNGGDDTNGRIAERTYGTEF